ncbi:phosphoribosylaminoimidazolesuccinocarboxamide synthase [Archaeoglobus profundus]|uniref:Phosphoribosylaminoimidazole-succinocarboxamide synthase n=1 Tax=Archaeoglobus profundus (strain DSM 5631 / JCM 9629 / NBRC 100127 / Av18) TaxID=572546 RepID=D2RHF2_ARCPA|nr:phosphoribosylaminoimidazolesuccinocarboxamide synthase [Archaeoglobus profundus]ADB57727.1 phosphoribosylaminoimidazole-succinocarboxamide synthase [Archaeoglobus profundus DSM 5631]
MGSVKDLIVIEEPKEDKMGFADFVFSDRYSVFDYGVMPDLIEHKGESLCLISAYFFEKLEDYGIKTHYIGLVENGKVKRFDEISKPTNVMRVKLARVVKPEKKNGYDYSVFRKLKGNFLIPLEVIYRNSIPKGSSLLRRIKEGKVKPEDFGLKEIVEGMKLEKPIIDFSTKLEDVDRYLSHGEAKEISGLSDEEFERLKEIALKVDEIITSEVSKVGLENEDGKIEFALDEFRNIIVVDAVGTPDECRFSYEGFDVSKELLREYYRKTEWYERLKEVKGKPNWRDIVGEPPKLSENVRILASKLYMALCNEITGKKFFDVPKLGEVVKEIKEVIR